MARPQRTLKQRIVNADVRASAWLADANEAAERGDAALAERFYEKAQFWKDRYTVLTNQANHPGPTR